MSTTEERKDEHVDISLNMDVESSKHYTGFRDVRLVHQAISDFDLSEVRLDSSFLGRRVGLPLIIAAMTGGSRKTMKINETLATVAERLSVPMGIGSVRAGIEDDSLSESFRVVRKLAPSVPIISNIGATQLSQRGTEVALKAIGLVEADALAIHLNNLQEAIMPEGEPSQRGIVGALGRCARELHAPIILKETGSGISAEVAELSKSLGIRYVDVGGAGGTNFAMVEQLRALKAGSVKKSRLGKDFVNWGIPTAVSLAEVLSVGGLHVIATGGLRSGVDAAKALAMGADMVGVALPLLKEALKGEEQLISWIEEFSDSLRCAMFLTGSRNLDELRNRPVVITGFARSWLQARGIDVDGYSRRRFVWS